MIGLAIGASIATAMLCTGITHAEARFAFSQVIDIIPNENCSDEYLRLTQKPLPPWNVWLCADPISDWACRVFVK